MLLFSNIPIPGHVGTEKKMQKYSNNNYENNCNKGQGRFGACVL